MYLYTKYMHEKITKEAHGSKQRIKKKKVSERKEDGKKKFTTNFV